MEGVECNETNNSRMCRFILAGLLLIYVGSLCLLFFYFLESFLSSGNQISYSAQIDTLLSDRIWVWQIQAHLQCFFVLLLTDVVQMPKPHSGYIYFMINDIFFFGMYSLVVSQWPWKSGNPCAKKGNLEIQHNITEGSMITMTNNVFCLSL